MIFIERDLSWPDIKTYREKLKVIEGVEKTISPYSQEKEKAIAFFTDPNHYENNKKVTRKTFTFSRYKDSALKEELQSIFGTKCAYCESDFGAVTPEDIEHFRPKSSISRPQKEDIKPGYYWMAADWENLLLSCPDCNRARKHRVAGQPRKVLLGKSDQFPLKDNLKRIRSHLSTPEDLQKENQNRLLLHPNIDNPEDHLDFDEQGFVFPKKKGGKISEKGKVSIFVYALGRSGLVKARHIEISRLIHRINELSLSIDQYHNYVNNGESENVINDKKNDMIRAMRAVKESISPNMPYLAAKKSVIKKRAATGLFIRLEKVGINLPELVS